MPSTRSSASALRWTPWRRPRGRTPPPWWRRKSTPRWAYCRRGALVLAGAHDPAPAAAGDAADPVAILNGSGRTRRGWGPLFPGDQDHRPDGGGGQAAGAGPRIDRLIVEDDTLEPPGRCRPATCSPPTGNFTALHGLTASHALRRVWAFVPEHDRIPALRRHWQALVCAWVTIGRPGAAGRGAPVCHGPFRPRLAADPGRWPRERRRPCVKSIYALWREDAIGPDRSNRYGRGAVREAGDRV